MSPVHQRWKNIMKASPFEEKRLLKWEPPFIIQPKYDGFRCRAVPLDNGEYMLLSSEENVFFSVPHINEACKQLPRQEWDGELYRHNLPFEGISSRVSRTVNLHPDYKDIQFHIFDYISNEPQAARLKFLGDTDMQGPLIRTPYWIAVDLKGVMEIYEHILAQQYEGIIVRHYAAPYERKRSTYVMKFKPKQEDIYAITGYSEEVSVEGNPKGVLGSLVCDSGDGTTFAVGTGFSNDVRGALWEVRDSLIGKFAQVQYQHITAGKQVPRFPVFVEIVNDEE